VPHWTLPCTLLLLLLLLLLLPAVRAAP